MASKIQNTNGGLYIALIEYSFLASKKKSTPSGVNLTAKAVLNPMNTAS